jgi:hypothetical protein
MSETIVRTPSEQAEVPAPAPEPEQSTVQEQAVAAAEQVAAAEEKAREEAEQTRKGCVRAYRQGEKSYRAGLLESGRLADLYCRQRVALGDKRAAAVQALEGELAKWSSTAVDVGRLIGCYHSFRLLAEEPGIKADGVAYGHYRDCWGQLVERQHKDTPEEGWALLPGLEQECRDLFAKATADGLSKAAVQEQVKALLRLYADRQAEEAAKARAAAEQEARVKAAAEEQARREALEAQRRTLEAKAAAEQGKEEEKARLTEQARLAEEEQRQKDRAAIEAAAAAEKAARDKARAEAQAKAAEEAKRRAEAKARKAQERKANPPKPRNLLPQDKGDAAAMAALAAEYVTDCDTPDDVLHALLLRLKGSEELSSRSKRAVEAALVILARPERRPEPVANGRAVAAA